MLDGSRYADWRQAHAARLSEAEGAWVLQDGPVGGHQVVELHEPMLEGRLVEVSAEILPLPGGYANFCVHHRGNIDVAVIDREGRLAASDPHLLRGFQCDVGADGRLSIRVVFWNGAGMLAVGMGNPGNIYQGTGAPQFEIARIRVTAAEPYRPTAEAPLVLVDVGAREGLDPAWAPHLDGLRLVMFEPDSEEAERIRGMLGPDRHLVIDKALSDRDGEGELYLTDAIGCSSLLEPDEARLAPYRVAPWFRVHGRARVPFRRYDGLVAQGAVPAPDVIKIDVQGLEYEVLQGFGETLRNAVAIELEAHFYPLYKGQKLIGDIVTLLDGYGFALRRIVPQGYDRFNHELAEMNAFFTTRRKDVTPKVAFVEQVWEHTNPR